ncbi:TlpA family protein disulfide reductase [Paraflavitalea pollutisoli]|uniref:TlpA family protein disulfide reductase n=1 Tax=Paraflavitalea pollutisoli TaxID=3034143 RepID=UPI0023EC6A48|nr:TlpA disulfide reductase family protein [Paraflavitalea sp. H1-2-19X]
MITGKRIKALIPALLYCGVLLAQDNIRSLNAGDDVPDVALQLFNSDMAIDNLADLKGKAIILDFWATWCKPCVSDLPKNDSIQKAYKDKLEIIPVTAESPEKVQSLLTRIKKATGVKVRTVVNDEVLSKLFPHKILPHYVWIGRDGVVKGITDNYALNEDNLNRFLGGQQIVAATKTDVVESVKMSYAKPMFTQHNTLINEDNLVAYSMVTRYMPQLSMAVGGGPGNEIGKGQYKIMITNETPVFLFGVAYALELTGSLFLEESRIMLETKDSLLYTVGHGPEWTDQRYIDWLKNHGVCYDLMVPMADTARLYKIMQKDLEKWFPLTANVEKRKKICYNLVKLGNSRKFVSQQPEGEADREYTVYNLKYDHVPMVTFMMDLIQYGQGWKHHYPFVNSSGYEGFMDLDITGDFRDYHAFRKELQKYGLDLVIEEADVEMLVIRDRK